MRIDADGLVVAVLNVFQLVGKFYIAERVIDGYAVRCRIVYRGGYVFVLVYGEVSFKRSAAEFEYIVLAFGREVYEVVEVFGKSLIGYRAFVSAVLVGNENFLVALGGEVADCVVNLVFVVIAVLVREVAVFCDLYVVEEGVALNRVIRVAESDLQLSKDL